MRVEDHTTMAVLWQSAGAFNTEWRMIRWLGRSELPSSSLSWRWARAEGSNNILAEIESITETHADACDAYGTTIK
jgi:hypothetical protein